jgi:hypothetical protein
MAKPGVASISLLSLLVLLLVQFCASNTGLLARKAASGGRLVSKDVGRYVVVFDAGKISIDVHVFRFDKSANLLKINGDLEVSHNVIF